MKEKIIKLWLSLKVKIGFKCNHDLEYQYIQWKRNEGSFIYGILNNMKHKCEYCGIEGIHNFGRLNI